MTPTAVSQSTLVLGQPSMAFGSGKVQASDSMMLGNQENIVNNVQLGDAHGVSIGNLDTKLLDAKNAPENASSSLKSVPIQTTRTDFHTVPVVHIPNLPNVVSSPQIAGYANPYNPNIHATNGSASYFGVPLHMNHSAFSQISSFGMMQPSHDINTPSQSSYGIVNGQMPMSKRFEELNPFEQSFSRATSGNSTVNNGSLQPTTKQQQQQSMQPQIIANQRYGSYPEHMHHLFTPGGSISLHSPFPPRPDFQYTPGSYMLMPSSLPSSSEGSMPMTQSVQHPQTFFGQPTSGYSPRVAVSNNNTTPVILTPTTAASHSGSGNAAVTTGLPAPGSFDAKSLQDAQNMHFSHPPHLQHILSNNNSSIQTSSLHALSQQASLMPAVDTTTFPEKPNSALSTPRGSAKDFEVPNTVLIMENNRLLAEKYPGHTFRFRAMRRDSADEGIKKRSTFDQQRERDSSSPDTKLDNECIEASAVGALNTLEIAAKMAAARRAQMNLIEEQRKVVVKERNRAAALRCRLKKKEWIVELQQRLDDSAMECDQLRKEYLHLRALVEPLRLFYEQHQQCAAVGSIMEQPLPMSQHQIQFSRSSTPVKQKPQPPILPALPQPKLEQMSSSSSTISSSTSPLQTVEAPMVSVPLA